MPDHSYEDVMNQINELLRASDQEQQDPRTTKREVDYASFVVRQFTQPLLEEAVRRSGLRYLKDQDGYIVVRSNHIEASDCILDLWLAPEGTDDSILAIHTYSNRRFSRHEIGRLFLACNRWNQETRWPSANVYVDEDSGSASVVLQMFVPLSSGVHIEFLVDYVLAMFFGSIAFWERNFIQLPAEEVPF